MEKVEDCPGFETFGEGVRAGREAQGISRKALAEDVNIANRYLASIELGEVILSIPVILQLVRICRLPVERYFNPGLIRGYSERRRRIDRKLQLCPEKYLPIVAATLGGATNMKE